MLRSRRPSSTAGGSEQQKNGYPYSADFENTVIVKQRKELQLLVNELHERDTELNELVATHQKQLNNWEADRKRLLTLEEKLRQKDQELQDKSGQLKCAMKKVEEVTKLSEERQQELQELRVTGERAQDETSQLRRACEELEDTNYQLERRLRETSSQLVQVETRSGQLEQDVHSAAQNLHQLLHKLKSSDKAKQELQKQTDELRSENEQLRTEIRKLANDSRELLRVNERQQQQVAQLNKDCQLAGERERRKDELLQSQRLKQERTDAELHQLRAMYERMQGDLSALTNSLETGREQEISVTGIDSGRQWSARSPASSSHRRSGSIRHRQQQQQQQQLHPQHPQQHNYQHQHQQQHQHQHQQQHKLSRVNSLPDLHGQEEQEATEKWTAATKRLARNGDYTKHLPSSYNQIDRLLYHKGHDFGVEEQLH